MNARIEWSLSCRHLALAILFVASSCGGCSEAPEEPVVAKRNSEEAAGTSPVTADDPTAAKSDLEDIQRDAEPKLTPADPAPSFPANKSKTVVSIERPTESSPSTTDTAPTDSALTVPADPEPTEATTSSAAAATVADAMQLLDLRKLPRQADATATVDTPTQVSLTVKTSVADATKFYTDLLEQDGWKLQEPAEMSAPATADYGQLNFTKQGYELGISLYKLPDTGLLSVGLNNYGNIDARSLPQPAKAESLFGNFNTVMYVTDTKVPAVAEACLEQLTAAGWQVYARPFSQGVEDEQQRSLTLKKNGVALSAYIAVAPAQMNRTSIQYAVHMLGDELPTPADAAKIEFMESPLQLTCETKDAIPATLEFYRQELAARGWHEKGAGNQQPSEAISVFQRSEGLPVVLKITRLGEDAPTTVSIAEFEMPREVPTDSLTEKKTGDPAPTTPDDESSLPAGLANLPTYEEWLKKNKYKPGIERLEQYAAEMEKIANSLGDAPAEESETEPAPSDATTPDTTTPEPDTDDDAPEKNTSLAPSAQASTAAIAAIEKAEGRVQTNDDEVLTFVELSSKTFGDKQMKLLAGMSEVTYLNLSFTQVTDAGLAVIADMPKLEKLYLSGLKISDAGLEVVAGLTELDLLIVSQTPITDAGLLHVKGLANLERLSLMETNVTDQGLASLVELSKLKALDLANTKITNAAIPHLVQLRALEELNLFGTKINAAGIKTLQAALPDCDINQ